MTIRLAVLFTCLGLLGYSVPSHATSVVRLGLEEMVSVSSMIVHGTVTSTQSHWNQDRTLIVTDVRVAVSETFRGAAASEVVVTQLGGTVGKLRVDVDGAAAFRVGDEVVLFLAPDARGDLHVTGLSQGRFDVVADPRTGAKTVQGLYADGFASIGTGLAPAAGVEVTGDATVLLPRFLEGLRGAVRNASVKPKQ